jgi:hypothetical protein
VPASEEVILDPNELTQGTYDRYAKAKIHAVVGQDGLREGILDVAHANAEEHVVDVERVTTAGADVHFAKEISMIFDRYKIGNTYPTLSKYSH